MANKKYRVLVAGAVACMPVVPNDVVELPESVGKAYAEMLDGNKAAVEYALSINGGVVRYYHDPDATASKTLQEEIDVLTKSLSDAAESDKAAIQTKIDEKQAASAALS